MEPRIAREGRFAEPRIAREGRFAEPRITREGCIVEPRIAREGRFAELRIAREGCFAEPCIALEGRFVELCITREGRFAEQRWAGKNKSGKVGYILELVTGEVRGRGFVPCPRCIILLMGIRILDPVPGSFQLAPFGQPILGPDIPGSAAFAEQRQAFFFVDGSLLFIRDTDMTPNQR